VNNRSRTTRCAAQIAFCLCLYLGCLFLVTPILAQQTVTYQDYLSRIGRWREQVREVQTQAGTDCAQVLGAVADELAGITAVQMPNGTTMSINHEGIVMALRAFPCDPARADSLLAGICPTQICPVGVVPPNNPDDLNFTGDFSSTNPPQLPGTPPPDVAQQVEELLQEGQPQTNAAGSGAEQPGSADTSGDQTSETGASEAGETGGSESTGGEEGTAATSETSSDTGETAGASSETAESDNAQAGEGEASGESGAETGTDGAESSETGATGTGTESGNDGGGDAANDTSGGDANSGEGANSEETGGTTAENTSETTAESPAATSEPPEIAPPVEPERSPWLWAIVALAIVVIAAGAILFIVSQPGDELQRRGRKQEPETAEEAVDEGRALVAAGNYRGAVRHLFLAALLTLDKRNLIQYDKTRTNHEILSEAELRSTIVDTLAPVVETFERVWYGFEAVGAAEYEVLVGQIELLKQG
jgi:hypothetical protein